MNIIAVADQNIEGYLAGGLFVLGCVGVLWFLALASGWRSLAKRYAGRPRAGGTTYRLQYARIGWVTYGGCLTISLSEAGLALAVWPPNRIGHPPLVIPWSDIRHVCHRRGLVFDRDELALGNPAICRISLSPRVVQEAKTRGYL